MKYNMAHEFLLSFKICVLLRQYDIGNHNLSKYHIDKQMQTLFKVFIVMHHFGKIVKCCQLVFLESII